ncbi:MAG: CYTH domain-containing protein, partial [Aliifodinibius sp.]|nr:class IV adenylate cyclase [Fodinibius sp.]NIV10764.1 CYTH domain-containing protein [Fodinibius sp.]NIY24370.1 CYTH domain-containing protein [Fodinibius sp.]
MQNIECKYKIVSPAKVQQRLASRADIHPKFRHFQKDIYFKVVQGRLKIRIENGFVPCLIEYYRDDGTAPRRSDYSLTPLPDYEKSLKELKNSYGILAEVEKWRELYLYKNVRIHLDDVMNLG